MIKPIISIALFIITSCANTIRKKVPLKGLFYSIAKERYVLGFNDCSNMSAKYFYAVKAIGYDPTIIVYKTKTGGYHAVVEVNGTYIDCTTARATLVRPSNIVYELKEEDLSKYNDEYKVR